MRYYHVTPEKFVPSILKRGIKAKVPANEDERGVYLFKSLDDAVEAIMNWLGDRFDEDEPLAIVVVDAAQIRVSTTAAAYEVISYSNVPASAIVGVMMQEDVDRL